MQGFGLRILKIFSNMLLAQWFSKCSIGRFFYIERFWSDRLEYLLRNIYEGYTKDNHTHCSLFLTLSYLLHRITISASYIHTDTARHFPLQIHTLIVYSLCPFTPLWVVNRQTLNKINKFLLFSLKCLFSCLQSACTLLESNTQWECVFGARN